MVAELKALSGYMLSFRNYTLNLALLSTDLVPASFLGLLLSAMSRRLAGN